jgi:signal transduction histidine kinase
MQTDLRMVEKETKRCKSIIDNLMRFARQEKAEKSPTNVNEVVEDALAIVRHQLELNQVRPEADLDTTLPLLSANANQLQQVFINFLVNAQQAMEGKKGTIRITTRRAEGNTVELRFADTGPGIPEEIRKRLFEPFFTTKPVGKGTGLGLSVSYGIIKDHAGEITVESEVGKGTTFVVRLPLTDVYASGVGVSASAGSTISLPTSTSS